MFDPKSDYALNKKDKNAIVCPSVTGIHTRLVREDFASEEEFLYWKSLSDGDYQKIETACRDYNDNCIRLTADRTTGESAEDMLVAALRKAEQAERQAALLEQVRDLLTAKQYRRLWLYSVKKMNEAQIAQAENVGQPRICRSIRRARKILEKYFSEGGKAGDKNG